MTLDRNVVICDGPRRLPPHILALVGDKCHGTLTGMGCSRCRSNVILTVRKKVASIKCKCSTGLVVPATWSGYLP